MQGGLMGGGDDTRDDGDDEVSLIKKWFLIILQLVILQLICFSYRGFSQTSNYLTDNRTCPSEASIRGILSTKDGLKYYDYQCNTVSFTNNLIKKGLGAHKLCLARLKKEKRIEAEQKKQEYGDYTSSINI
uniref:(California timema) hypothetical protein n=1 Tax=Timema californicum TaxID=61474 RepID=A0A7R9J656_TIMCA|nr:unnamed protein product [Timema californicum]